MLNVKSLALAAALGVSALGANAATIINVGTSAGTGGPFVGTTGVLVDSDDAAYAGGEGFSNWVWDANGDNTVTYTVTFNLTSFQIASAVLSGLWGVDNIGTVLLNGVQISELTYGVGAFASLTSYGSSNDGEFMTGVNTLQFVALNDISDTNGGPGPVAFRATVNVSAIPVPAALPLLAGAVGLLGFGAARRRNKAQN